MLEKEKDVDAVLCSTPDHSHAHVCVFAMRSGRHVYCEKPLTHNIWEARHVARVARETKVATQMGNQGHATGGIRETVEYLQAGAIGTVHEVHAWVGAQWVNPIRRGAGEQSPPVPAGLNWDLWLGPCEPRPFHPAYFPVGWRHFWVFGNGRLGDFGCHDFDAATWAFGLQAPLSVEAFAAGATDVETSPSGEVVYFEFAPQSGQPAPKLTFHGGGLRPRAPEALGNFRLPGRGVLFIGSKGAIQCDGAGGAPRLFPEALRAGYIKPVPSLLRSPGHLREWLDACKGGPQAGSNFDYGARLTEIALLGALAVRTRRRIEWDAESMQAKAFLEAETLIRQPYRVGWNLQ
jgi:predicted dehydrogenase